MEQIWKKIKIKKKMREKRIVFFLLVLFEIYNFLKVEREATIATLSRL